MPAQIIHTDHKEGERGSVPSTNLSLVIWVGTKRDNPWYIHHDAGVKVGDAVKCCLHNWRLLSCQLPPIVRNGKEKVRQVFRILQGSKKFLFLSGTTEKDLCSAWIFHKLNSVTTVTNTICFKHSIQAAATPKKEQDSVKSCCCKKSETDAKLNCWTVKTFPETTTKEKKNNLLSCFGKMFDLSMSPVKTHQGNTKQPKQVSGRLRETLT